MDHQPVPFAWFDKIALLLLAADLEGHGGLVRLSVAPSALPEGGSTGTDWARAIKVVRDRGRAFLTGDGPEGRAAYRAAIVGESERDELRLGLREFLRSAVAADVAYRYDGIWHDDGGNVDLAAWRQAEVLIVEAKGAIQRAGAIDWRVASTDTTAVAARTVGTGEVPHARRGILLPDDHGIAPTGRGFVHTLLHVWPDDRPEDARWPIYLVGAEGAIAEWSIAGLRRRST